MTPLRLGLIGVGKHGVRYARHILNDLGNEARLVALARRSRDAAAAQAAEFGCRAHTDHRELIAAADVDAVIVVVPPTFHPAICAAVVAAGKPALFEKPAAASLPDAREMMRLGGGAPIMVAQTLRYNSVVRAILAARDEVGPLHAIRLSQRFEPSPLGWIDTPEISGGGMLLHTGVHSFDLVRLLSGREVERVYCERASIVTARTEDNYAVTLRVAGGLLASVNGSRCTRSRSGPIELVGAEGMLQGDHVFGTAAKVMGTSLTPLAVAPAAATVKEVLRDFVAAVRRGGPMPIPLIEGLRASAIAAACYESSRTGAGVAVATLDVS